MDHLSYMQLCRLCLVKDKVNVPIFDDANDVRQIFLKITACLPVKVSRDDNLPKKICNECLYKIDSLYQFWNTTINAEKQLLQWLNEIGVDTTVTNAAAPLQQILPQSHAHPHTEEIILKEEALEDLKPEHNNIIFPSYIPNQQQPPPPNLTKFQPADEEEEDDPPRRRTRGRPAKKKAASVLEAALTAQDSDSVDSDRLADGGADDSDYVDEERVTKEEVDSDEDYVDPLEPTQFVNVSNDAEQPGPSGLNNTAKSTTTLQPPTHTDTGNLTTDPLTKLSTCDECGASFTSARGLKIHQNSRHAINGRYSCNLCAKKFNTEIRLKVHMQRLHAIRITDTDQTAKQSLVCTVCQKKFTNRARLFLHQKLHSNPYNYKCEKCDKGFLKQLNYIRHVKMQHEERERNICFPCDKIIYDYGFFLEHMAQHNPNYKSLQCDGCHKKFQDERKFVEHIKTHQNICDICNKAFGSAVNLKEHRLVHGKKPYVCEKCGFKFETKSLLDYHVQKHDNALKFTCGECGKNFTQKSIYIIHQRIHTGDRPFICDICDKKFISQIALNAHSNTHRITTSNEPKNYTCSICDETVSNLEQLKYHMHAHNPEKRRYICFPCNKSTTYQPHYERHMNNHNPNYVPQQFVCDSCGKVFEYRWQWSSHIRRSHRTSPFICDICGKSLTTHSGLKNHKTTHSSDRPWVCAVCDRKFTTKKLLRVHGRVHDADRPIYTCDVCDKQYTELGSLKIHHRIHTGDRPYQCDNCEGRFRTIKSLRNHVKRCIMG